MSIFSNQTFFITVAGGLCVAIVLWLASWFFRTLHNRKNRNSRIICIRHGSDLKPVRSCDVVHRESKTRSELKSDVRGRVSIPPSWPNKCWVQIEHYGRVLVIEEVDFTKSNIQEITIP